jgi:DDE family transposase
VQVSHRISSVSVAFDEDNLLADAGLVPVMALAEQAGLGELVDEHVAIVAAKNAAGANPGAKVTSIVAGMVAGADSFDDMNRLRAGAAGKIFTGIRAPSTLGTFLRAFTHSHNQQLEHVFRQVTANLVQVAGMLPGADEFAFVDIDSMHLETYGYAKQGAVNGRLKGKKTLHPLTATISTPLARPVVAGLRMRKGNSADMRGAARFTTQALKQAHACGATGIIVLRADSKFYSAKVVAAALRHGAQVSITTGSNPAVNAAITA